MNINTRNESKMNQKKKPSNLLNESNYEDLQSLLKHVELNQLKDFLRNKIEENDERNITDFFLIQKLREKSCIGNHNGVQAFIIVKSGVFFCIVIRRIIITRHKLIENRQRLYLL